MGRLGRLIIVIASIVLLIAVIVTLIVSIVSNVEPNTNIYPAEIGTFSNNIKTKAYIFKDDVQLTTIADNGFVKCVFENDNVEKGKIIGQVFPSASEEQIKSLSDIYEKIDRLNKCNKYLQLSQSETELEMSKITNLISSTNDANIIRHYSYTFDLLKLRHELFYSTNDSYKYQLLALEEEKKMLVEKMGASMDVKSNYSGIFSDYYDGYESLLNVNSISDIQTIDDNFLISYVPHIENNAFGSILQNNKIHCVCSFTLNLNDISNIDTIYLTNISHPISVDAKVLSYDEKSKTAIVDFEFDYSNDDFIYSRVLSIDVITNVISGLKVKKIDIYDIKGTNCVYVKENGVARIREIEIIGETGEYYIVSSDNATKYPKLKLGEEIITGVYRVYDGKAVKWV